MKSLTAKVLPPLNLVFPAVLSGVLVTLGFPNVSLGALSFVALVPILAAVLRARPGRRESFKTGLLFGVTCYVTMLWWIVKLIPSADVTIPWLMTPALIILALYLALYPAFFFLVLGSATRYRLVAVLLAVPSLWAVFELARTRGELAFPWGALGYALSYMPEFIQGASVFGLFGLSFLIVLVNTLLAVSLVSKDSRARLAATAAAIAVIAAMWVQGRDAIERVEASESQSTRIAIVQPNIDLTIKWKPEYRDSTFRVIARMAAQAAAAGAELSIFPETSAPVYIENAPAYKDQLQQVAALSGVPFYIGFLDHRYDGPDRAINIYNSSGVFHPDGRLDKYDKNHLLPFGESLPLSSRFRWIRKIDFGQANFQSGPSRGPVDGEAISFTPLICFESVFPYLCRRGVMAGSELLVNITNDGWFSDTPGPFQHAQMSIMRSVEFRRYLVRSANTGVSMVVSPAGRIIESIGLFERGMILADVEPRLDRTTYARVGDWPVLIAGVVLTLLGIVAGRAGART